MHIKRFEGKTLAELLERIRTELGEDALILETRKNERGRVEVVAARPHANDVELPARASGHDSRPDRPSSHDVGSRSTRQTLASPTSFDTAGEEVLAHGAAQAYARLGGTPKALPVDDAPPRGSRGGSAVARVAQILSRMPRSDSSRQPNRAPIEDLRYGSTELSLERAGSELVTADDTQDTWRTINQTRQEEDWRTADDAADREDDRSAPTHRVNLDEWREAANAAYRTAAADGVIEPDELEAWARSSSPAGLSSTSGEESAQRARIEYLGRLVRSEHFSAIPLPLRELYLDLVDAEIDANLVFQILSKMGNAPMPGQFATAPPDQLLALLRKLVRVGGAVQASDPPRVIALVGPTGVGKTTTVAKIAGHAAFHLRKRVGLVSTDSYRIFGAQHLASYAALMGMTFESATDTAALQRVVSRYAEKCDLLLIDTSGRSPRDPEGIAETERLLAACPDLDVHLVLAANSRVRDQALALERFSTLPIRHLIFTKLDETTRRGGLFTVALKAARPVSYLGTGQEVPDDLEEATIAGLTEVIAETLQKESVHA